MDDTAQDSSARPRWEEVYEWLRANRLFPAKAERLAFLLSEEGIGPDRLDALVAKWEASSRVKEPWTYFAWSVAKRWSGLLSELRRVEVGARPTVENRPMEPRRSRWAKETALHGYLLRKRRRK